MTVSPQTNGVLSPIDVGAIEQYFKEPAKYQLVVRYGNLKESQIQILEKSSLGYLEWLFSFLNFGPASTFTVVWAAREKIKTSPQFRKPNIEKAISLFEQKDWATISLKFLTCEEIINFFPFIKNQAHDVICKIFSKENISDELRGQLFDEAVSKVKADILQFLQKHRIKNKEGLCLFLHLIALPNGAPQNLQPMLKELLPTEIAYFEEACLQKNNVEWRPYLQTREFCKILEHHYGEQENIFHRIAPLKGNDDCIASIFHVATKQVPALLQIKNKKNQTPITILRQNGVLPINFYNKILADGAFSLEQKILLILGPQESQNFKNISFETFQNRLDELKGGFEQYAQKKSLLNAPVVIAN